MKTQINYLSLSWSVSRGRETYGYNICKLHDRNNGKNNKTVGGGYDMVGTVFAMWLEENYQAELLKLVESKQGELVQAYSHYKKLNGFYGMTVDTTKNAVYLDGGCGLDCIIDIALAIGLDIQRDYVKTGKKRGETLGWWVHMSENETGIYKYCFEG